MKVLIVAPSNDNHTAPLKWALEQAGVSVVCWAGLGCMEERQASISLLADARLQLGKYVVEPGDVVWVRRPQPPQLNPRTAPEDRKFAVAEYRWFFQSVMYLLETLPVRCVNKYSASRFINNKSVQLTIAKACGLNVPGTLMTNCPDEARDHFRRGAGRTICKSFFPHIWKKDPQSSIAVTETFELTPEMLPEDDVLTYAPAIYQEMVVKRFDVRMVLLGRTIYSHAIHNPAGSLDWRQEASRGLVQVQPVATPLETEQGVLAFASRSGIAYGSFDFAVDMDGRWWFLEVNEGGQFLWLDDFNPNLHLQEKFSAFLVSPEDSPRQIIEERQSLFPSWSDYLASPAKDEQPSEEPESEAAFISIEG